MSPRQTAPARVTRNTMVKLLLPPKWFPMPMPQHSPAAVLSADASRLEHERVICLSLLLSSCQSKPTNCETRRASAAAAWRKVAAEIHTRAAARWRAAAARASRLIKLRRSNATLSEHSSTLVVACASVRTVQRLMKNHRTVQDWDTLTQQATAASDAVAWLGARTDLDRAAAARLKRAREPIASATTALGLPHVPNSRRLSPTTQTSSARCSELLTGCPRRSRPGSIRSRSRTTHKLSWPGS